MTRFFAPILSRSSLLALLLLMFCWTGCSEKQAVFQPAVAKLIEKAAQYKQEGKLDEANARLKAAADLTPDVFQVQYNLGIVYSEQANWPGATSALEKAVSLDPSHASALYSLALDYQSWGDQLKQFSKADPNDKEAIAALPQAVRAVPRNQALAEASLKYQKAVAAYKAFLSKAPQNDPGRADAESQLRALENQ